MSPALLILTVVYGAQNMLSSDSHRINTLFFFSSFSRAVPTAYGGSQARGPIGAVAYGLHHSHSSSESEPQLMAVPDLLPTEQGQGLNLQRRGS